VSKASPKLFLACASGQHLKEARLVGRKAGKDLQEFLTWTFSDVLVSSYQTGGTEQALPMDSVSLNFSKVSVAYKAQKADGSLDTAVTAGWDIKTNKKV
jgi:type VI secretion system secreted protein Hcp